MTVINPSNTEHYTWGKNNDGWPLLRTGTLSVIEERVHPGNAEVRHRHARAQQFFFILEGSATMEIEGKQYELARGDSIHIQAGQAHQFRNEGDSEVRFLVISQPDSRNDRIPA